MTSIKDLLDQIIADGVITQEEHDEFIAQIGADGKIDAEESAQISRLFRLIQEGTIRIADSDREKAMAARQSDLDEKLKSLEKPKTDKN